MPLLRFSRDRRCAGVTREGVALFERYVDASSDVQTAAVALLQALPCAKLSSDRRLRQWMEDYRELLNRWSLWS